MARVRSRSYQRPVNPAQDFSDWYVVAPTSAPCGATSPVNLVCMQYIRFTSWLPPPPKKNAIGMYHYNMSLCMCFDETAKTTEGTAP